MEINRVSRITEYFCDKKEKQLLIVQILLYESSNLNFTYIQNPTKL